VTPAALRQPAKAAAVARTMRWAVESFRPDAIALQVGLGRSVALCYRSSTSYQIHLKIRGLHV
jgi:hypothetical protein